MSEPDPQALDALFGELLHTEDAALTAARETADVAGMPRIEVSAQHAKLLSILARITRATRVLEIGTLAGYSTIALARGVGPAGRVVTLEYEPEHAEVALANLRTAGVEDRVEIIVGTALETLPHLAERGERFDMFFIDADKENNSAYVRWAVGLAAPGALVVIDNIARSGRVLDPAPDDHQARAVKDMFAMMGSHPRLDTAAIQTVGTKGWDGFAIAVVLDEESHA
ncbi:O-methyltransferase [Mycolicibacterium sp.]|uniref:O-methyltransferase n=1 Tax=Mycolicibacterium sp. TaxID=2320850 RepID=UPI001A2DE303|nr:O-methyltransferase [Mycolicibacterium sp.]MBJ7339367.1 O-methyltransferase [Mycolicibacterium sp.]